MDVPTPPEELRFGPYELRPCTQELFKHGLRVKLPPQAFRVLQVLLERPGQLVSREKLHRALWSADTFVDFERGLNNAIKKIRDALSDSAEFPRYIETLERLGYRFIGEVTNHGNGYGHAMTPGPWPMEVAGPTTEHTRVASKTAWIVGGLLLTAGLVLGSAYYLAVTRAEPGITEFVVNPPEGQAFYIEGPPRVSPDGRKLVFTVNDPNSGTHLWMRRLDSVAMHELPGTGGVQAINQQAWSPDSRYLLFVADARLKRIDTEGGVPDSLCDVKGKAVGGWSSRHTVLVTPSTDATWELAPIQRINLEDCSLSAVTRLDRGRYDFGHQWPSFLPDGEHFLYSGLRTDKKHDVLLGKLGSDAAEVLVHNASNPKYAAPGFIFFERGGFLFVQPFSLSTLRLGGEPVQAVSEQLMFSGLAGMASYDVTDGVLVYQKQEAFRNELAVVDHSGKRLATFDESAVWSGVRLSPDTKSLVAGKLDLRTHTSDLWTYDLPIGRWSRLSFESTNANDWSLWSPDATSIVYAAVSKGEFQLYRTSRDHTESPEVILSNNLEKRPNDWSPNGRFLLYTQITISGQRDLWVMPMKGQGKPYPLTQTRFDEAEARFSPDGRWIVYSSDESGTREIYARTFLGETKAWRISSNGGRFPVWSRDGRHIYYLAPGGNLMELPVKVNASIRVGVGRPLFTLPGEDSEYEVFPDGKFLVNKQPPMWSGPPTVVLHWTAALGHNPRTQ